MPSRNDGTITQLDNLEVKTKQLFNYTTQTGAGAISLDYPIVKLVTTGTDALTLADGIEGQIIRISMITDAGAGTLTPASVAGYATITFNDVGDSVTLAFVNSKWAIISNNGCTIA